MTPGPRSALQRGRATGERLSPSAVRFQERLGGADGILLASPEYNYSLPGTLKNAIDWVSRMRPVPLRGKSAFLLAASSGPIGGIRGLWQLRIPLEGLGVFVHPDMYTLPLGAEAFADDGTLRLPQDGEGIPKRLRPARKPVAPRTA